MYPIPHNMRPRLITKELEPPFSKRSANSFFMPEELRCEAQKKYEYLKSHLDNVKAFLGSNKVNDKYELTEHGKASIKRSNKFRILNARKYTALIHEIQLIQGEVDRLQAILTA